MQTPSRPTANSLPPTLPVSTLDRRRDLATAFPLRTGRTSTASQVQQRAAVTQLPRVNADMQHGNSRQVSSSAASGLSDKSNASKTPLLGASKSSSASQRSLALDGVSATQVGNLSSAALKISTKRSMPHISASQPLRSSVSVTQHDDTANSFSPPASPTQPDVGTSSTTSMNQVIRSQEHRLKSTMSCPSLSAGNLRATRRGKNKVII